MSESNGKPGAQSFSHVTDRRQFLEFTGTPRDTVDNFAKVWDLGFLPKFSPKIL
jgi:hypothetical protein